MTVKGDAQDIAQEFGGLPLVLSHAVAYIMANQCFNTYLKTYCKSHSQVIKLKLNLLQNYSWSVAVTMQKSFECLPAWEQDLLQLFACLDSRSIP